MRSGARISAVVRQCPMCEYLSNVPGDIARHKKERHRDRNERDETRKIILKREVRDDSPIR
jgi:hypothetical protein